MYILTPRTSFPYSEKQCLLRGFTLCKLYPGLWKTSCDHQVCMRLYFVDLCHNKT
jgi:hypothetical protein